MSLAAIIFDFQQHARHIDASESHPHSLGVLGEENRPALDWTLETLRQYGVTDTIYVGDYHIEKVISRFPELKVRYVPSVGGAQDIDLIEDLHAGKSPLLLINASTIILPGALEKLCDSKAAFAVDARDGALGAYYLCEALAGNGLAALRKQYPAQSGVSIHHFFSDVIAAEPLCLEGLAASVTDQEAVAGSIFRGKAQTLDNLAPLLKDAVFLPRERVRIADWQHDKSGVIVRIQQSFAPQTVVVRSSVVGEDGLNKSFAGKYLSVLGVPSGEQPALERAVEEVIASYGEQVQADDEVLVQPQVQAVKASGVLLTRDTRSGGPYFVLNEDRTSGRSDSVTAGDTNAIVQRFIAWSATEGLEPDTERLLALARELVRLSCLDALDIEYIIDLQDRIYILQVRPLAAARKRSEAVDSDVLTMIAGAKEFAASRMRPLSGLLGDTTILGVMPDWNPAEMIGLSPRPLALSLYQKLIGESAWAEARSRVGYKNVWPESLIISLGGRPYVDVRTSLNSFLPATLDAKAGTQWVNFCLDRLKQDQTLHDKIEFELAITCLAPDWSQASKRLKAAGVNVESFRKHLRDLTQSILREECEPIAVQFDRLQTMAARREKILAARQPGFHEKGRQLSYLLDDCRQLGLVSFSILARYAFISMSFLRGFQQTGAISTAQYDEYLQSLPTVASQITADLHQDLPLEVLVQRYGHLRPNSYEITSGNYASEPDWYLRSQKGAAQPQAKHGAESVLLKNRKQIAAEIASLELDISVDALLEFVARSIAGREQAKFEFMKNLNAVLEIAASLGDELGLTRDQISCLSIGDLMRLGTDSIVPADKIQLRRRAAYNEKRWMVTRVMHLPDVVVTPADVEAFTLEPWRANFITGKRVVGRPVWIDETPQSDIDGAIVIIRAADPGYDWIFAHPIAGLVTEFGGVASHMSIRAAEFGLPAAIGCGSVVIELLRGAVSVELDCAAEKVRAVAC
ncbi:PEP/pyruvate-binding domain-containing protein [Rhodoferax saidenbachensis]|uniref:Phosphohistidine swiveling domain-containing protein n=1 Tax=Rhodoferax saidenbachensis TaxID=1484693 RepID=A0ABU1ZKH4_9BURK|nr:PEP/pyruvate-binding domain-containing protein [Rhodoferax saidenbachensis]MDR7306047.1 phosphohistidine swiveling domain-containing protein [Rhodoferax saidenbachensis]